MVEYCQVNALCFSACLCVSLLGLAVAGIAAEDAEPANDQPSATSTETYQNALAQEADRRVNQLINLDRLENPNWRERYRLLRENRRRITEQIDFYDEDIRDRKNKIYYLQEEIDDLQGRKDSLGSLKSTKEGKIKDNIDRLQKAIEDANKEIGKEDREIGISEARRQKLSGVIPEYDARISELLSFETREDKFRSGMSWVYAVLVGVLILGFFAVVWMSGKGGEVFSNQQGLQFITLFSLVIAIILFGVLKILEAKELSALLGAISGYVLGRVSAGEVKSAMSKAPGAPAAGGGT